MRNISLMASLRTNVTIYGGVLDRIAAAQRDLSYHRALARSIVFDPINLCLIMVAWASGISGFSGLPFRQEPAWLNHVVLGFFLILHLVAQYYWLGSWFFRGLRLGVPILVIYCAFYTTSHIIFHLIVGPVFFDENFQISLDRFMRTYPIALLITAAYGMSFLEDAKIKLSNDPLLVPTYWPISSKVLERRDSLEQIAGGMPRYMQAGKDGTLIVTENGQKIIRMPLAKLAEMTLADQGLHCHRSLWVASDQVVDLVHINGNPQVKLQGGLYFPVSRKSVADLRACVDANGSKHSGAI